MKYTFLRKGEDGKETEEQVEGERWGWAALYRNGGTLVKQFDDFGKFHQFKEIDQDQVDLFIMAREDSKQEVIMKILPGMQIFHFYRNFGFDFLGAHRKAKVYCFGWKDPVKETACYYYILPDDRIVCSQTDIDVTRFHI